MASEKPIAEALILCDEIINEAGTNKKSLIGTFNSIVAGNFPTQHPKMCVYAAMTNGQGTLRTELRCTRVDGQREVFRAAQTVQFMDPNQVIEMGFSFRNVPFEEPGLYAFELLAGDEMLMEKRFSVMRAQAPQG